MDDIFCVKFLSSAIHRQSVHDIFNTDHGAHYTGKAFTGLLREHSIKNSVDDKGRAMDNISIEHLWCFVNYEKISQKTIHYSSITELVLELKNYFDFYNYERVHQSLNVQTTAEGLLG